MTTYKCYILSTLFCQRSQKYTVCCPCQNTLKLKVSLRHLPRNATNNEKHGIVIVKLPVYSYIRMSVCLSVCLSVCPSLCNSDISWSCWQRLGLHARPSHKCSSSCADCERGYPWTIHRFSCGRRIETEGRNRSCRLRLRPEGPKIEAAGQGEARRVKNQTDRSVATCPLVPHIGP